MSIYTVYEPPLRAHESAPDPERFVFVRDGFSFWAFLLAPLWMLRHRMWLVLLGYVVVTIALVASRLVSVTFIPLLGYYLLRGQRGFYHGGAAHHGLRPVDRPGAAAAHQSAAGALRLALGVEHRQR